ncbi:MAG: hypothetical protein FWD26_03875 [Treponema sp.]|nr:hypothetical protein [Treponema sp.]
MEKLNKFKMLKETFKKDEAAGINEAKDRVWQSFDKKRNFMERPSRPRSYNLMHRRISIPLPAAAAAAVLIALLAMFWTRGTGNNNSGSMMAQVESAERSNFALAADMDYIEEIPGIIPVADMGGLLQYLTPNVGTNIIILQLPESQNFSRAGEPAIIRAADFSRQQPNGRRRP